MRLEIISAADFLVQLLRLQTGQVSESQLQMFKNSLTDLLRRRYRDHWFPDKPNRGSGYRCIRINNKMDPVIAQAGINVGLVPTLLRGLFPSELTMWIDPAEVSYRIGENGSICVLFDGSVTQPEQPPSPEPEPVIEHRSSGMSYYHYQPQQLQMQHHQQHYSSSNHQNHHLYHHYQQQQQQFESCKDSLLLEHSQFSEQIAAFVSS